MLFYILWLIYDENEMGRSVILIVVWIWDGTERDNGIITGKEVFIFDS